MFTAGLNAISRLTNGEKPRVDGSFLLTVTPITAGNTITLTPHDETLPLRLCGRPGRDRAALNERIVVNIYRRGRRQMSLFHLPEHGDIVTDTDGVKWTVKMEGGFKLRHDGQSHPAFLNGPMGAIEFAQWYNYAFTGGPECKICGGNHPVGCCAQDGHGG